MATTHAEHGQVVDLQAIHPGTMSHAIVKTDRFETIRLALPAGQSIPSHSVDGPVTIHCVTGRVNVSVEGRDNEMTPGTWMYLEGGIAHAVEAREESVVLLTIIF